MTEYQRAPTGRRRLPVLYVGFGYLDQRPGKTLGFETPAGRLRAVLH